MHAALATMSASGSLDDVAGAAALLESVENRCAGRTGAVVLGPQGQPVGTILVEQGRICWAAAAGMTRRLTDLLRSRTSPPLPAHIIEAVYERCRREGVPLGEALVAAGIVEPAGLRAALLQHTAEAVRSLASAAPTEAWIPHQRSHYDARFTFEAAEIWAAVGALACPAEAAWARTVLDAIVEDLAYGLAALPGRQGMVAVARAGDATLRELVALGSWGAHAIDVAEAFASRSLVSATADEGGGAVAFRSQGVDMMFFCPDRSSLNLTVARYSRWRKG